MTGCALRFEIGATCDGVAYQQVQRYRRSGRRRSLSARCGLNAVDVLGKRADVFHGESDRRHCGDSRIPAAVANDRLQQFPCLIVQHESRPQEVWTSLVTTA